MQKKTHSIIEAFSNTVIAYTLSVLIFNLISQWYNLGTSHIENFQIVGIFTVFSIVRNYILRRIFNNITIKEYNKKEKKCFYCGDEIIGPIYFKAWGRIICSECIKGTVPCDADDF